jgi:hypothetical protein
MVWRASGRGGRGLSGVDWVAARPPTFETIWWSDIAFSLSSARGARVDSG